MTDSMMEKLYYGLLSPSESETENIMYVEQMKEYRQHVALMVKMMGDDQELKQSLKDLQHIMDDLVCARAEDMFYKGFSMGARLTAEALLLENQ